jgi:hypothetical protein
MGLARDQSDQEQSRHGPDEADGLGCGWHGDSDAAWWWWWWWEAGGWAESVIDVLHGLDWE